MIKLIACLLMLTDHIGHVFFTHIIEIRYVGRLAMPFFAYSIARGFYYSNQKGTVKKYIRNMAIFALISQVPFHFFVSNRLNIGVTWLLSLFLLDSLVNQRELYKKIIVFIGVFMSSYIINIDYGLYGVLFPLCFYFFLFSKRNILLMVLSFSALFGFYLIISNGTGTIQVYTFFCIPLLLLTEPYDHYIKINKYFFYLFYPVHIAILELISRFIAI